MKVQWEGVMPALTTKFDEADRLDLALFEKKLVVGVSAERSRFIQCTAPEVVYRQRPPV